MVDVTQADREARRHIETLEWLATQYLPGGPRDVKAAIRFATDAARHRTEAVKPLVEAHRDVLAERERQVSAEGWTLDGDDACTDGRLAKAASCYALAGMGGNGPFWITALQVPQQVWPYRWEWKPKDRRTNLVRAAALILAEIERLDRAALREVQP
jgi:hypothetical protein